MEQDIRNVDSDKTRRTMLTKVALVIPCIVTFNVDTLRAKASTTWTGGKPVAPK